MTIDKTELKERLSAEITEIAKSFEYSPDKLSEFLSFGSRFREYSYRNVQMIYAQRPTATFVAAASKYFAGLPNAEGVPLSKDPLYIKKGEKAIYIYAPWEVRYYSRADGDKRTWSKLTASEKKDYKANPQNWTVSTSTYFKLVPVFDLGQVNCPKELLPAVLGVGTDSLTAAEKFDKLRNYAEDKLHIPVAVEDFSSLSLRGTYNISANAIRINSALGDTQRLSTLIHELAHSQLHFAPTAKSTAQKETEADMYAVMLEKYCGIDTTDARKKHLSDNYKEYISSLPPTADKTEAINTVFDNVFKRWHNDIPDISACLAAEHSAVQDLAARQNVKHR